MQQKKLYSKNPISEALIDIQLDQQLNLSANDLKNFSSKIGSHFPNVQERQMLQTTFQLEGGKPVQSQVVGIEGYEFWNKDRNEVVQARKSGFSFSRINSYESWEKHFPDAMKYWSEYQNYFKISASKRLAVRFINLIKIPEAKISLKDYLTCGPDVPQGLPENLESFLYRVVVPFNSNTKAVVTVAPGNPTTGGGVDLLLDIDVFAMTQVPISTGFEKVFESLHNSAETIFEAYITDKTRELIR